MRVHELKRPIEHKGASYLKLTLRRVNLGDLVAQERVDGDFARLSVMISRLAGIEMEVAELIDPEDLETLSSEVASLMGKPAAAAGSTQPS